MQILYEDNHLIAVNKPFGMPSQGDISRDQSVVDWVKAYLKKTYQKPGNVYVGLLHRLDRPTGGVLLLAKTSKAATRVSQQFQAKQPRKVYLAITEKGPHPPQGKLRHYLKKLPGKNIVRVHERAVRDTKEARLRYHTRRRQQGKVLLEIELETGRRHQIRAQLGSIGCPILGDVKYGKTAFLPDKSIALLAYSLHITHPTLKSPLHIQAPWPNQPWWQSFRPRK